MAEGGAAGAMFLGVVQGLTEFLPVSSSGHLVLFQQFLELPADQVLFDLVLHVGTLIPVLWVFRRTVWEVVRDPFVGAGPFFERPGVRMAWMVALASLPTAAIGLGFQDLFEALFATPAVLVVTFTITGGLLWLTRDRPSGAITLATMMPWHALALGVAQGIAITPGISRSGTTICVALLLGLDRELAGRFSFLMSVPAILGATLLQARGADPAGMNVDAMLLAGLTALVTGYAALVLLMGLVKAGRLAMFAPYVWVMAGVAGAIAVWRGIA
jgi:undecaprenyl-diphosphatase